MHRSEIIAHLFECANIADVALQVSSVPLGNGCSRALRSSGQQTSVAAHELASEAQIVGQPHEWIKRVVWEAGYIEAIPQAPSCSTRGWQSASRDGSGQDLGCRGREALVAGPSRTNSQDANGSPELSRFTKHEAEAVGFENPCDCRHACGELSDGNCPSGKTIRPFPGTCRRPPPLPSCPRAINPVGKVLATKLSCTARAALNQFGETNPLLPASK